MPVYWSVGDEEELYHHNIDEAIEAFIDDCHPDKPPEIIELVGYKRMEPKASSYTDRVLDDLLDRIDEEHGNPGGDPNAATDKMHSAARVFVKAVLADYTPWACEPVVRQTVNTAEWMKKNEA